MGRVWSGSGKTRIQTLLFFIDPDQDPDPKSTKFSKPDPNPLGSLMGSKNLFDLSHLNLL